MCLFLCEVTAAAAEGWPPPRIVGWSVLAFLAALPFVGLLLWRNPDAVDHHHPGFLRKWIFSVDHKIVGIQFLITGLLLFLVGGVLALGIRWQLAWPFDPEHPMPYLSEVLDWPKTGKTDLADADDRILDRHEVRAAQKAGVKLREVRLAGRVAPADKGEGEEPGAVGEVVKVSEFGRYSVVTVKDAKGRETRHKFTKKTDVSAVGGGVKAGGAVRIWDYKGPVMPADFYLTLMTMHASVMIFLVIVPMLVGVFGNYVVPLMIGARDMAFPRLNMFTYWLMPLGAYIMLLGFLAGSDDAQGLVRDGGAWAGAGWTSYPPLSVLREAAKNGSAVGQTTWAISILILGVSAVLGSVNYITTIVKCRAPGMTLFRMPLTVWSVLITAILSLMSTPVLAAGLLLLLSDRLLGTSFFVPDNLIVSEKPMSGVAEGAGHSGGGQVLLFQHLFWFYSHPAVYLMILPAMGIVSDILSVFARKPLFGYHAMVISIAAIAGLGFVVWGHHMFQSGMNPWLGLTFMISTFAIALPSGVKTFNWLATLWRSQIRYTTAMLNALAFVSMFVIGGLSGIYMAATPVDVQVHATYFIVGHIHYVLFGGSTFALFAGIYFWYPKMFGRMMSERLGVLHFVLTFVFFNATFSTMHILGAAGMHRRIADPYVYEYLAHLQWMNKFMTMAAIGLGLAQIPFAINFVGSWLWGAKAPDNPWKAGSLEWQTPSPPGHGNFDAIPVVVRGPYEYGSPEATEDWLAQNAPAGPKKAEAVTA
jgi:cytochrome c oxidase subunit 1